MKKKFQYTDIAAVCAALLLLIQRFWPWFGYGAVMDDWFLYGDQCDDIWAQHIIPNQKFAIRPLAGLFDTFVAAPLFKHLWAAQLIICALIIAAAILLCRTLKRSGFSSCGALLLTVCLFPLNLEATYWIAAAIRNVCALFFIALAAFLLSSYSERKKYGFLIGYILAGLAAVGFCEQAILPYLLISAALIFKDGDKRLLIIPLLQLAAIGVYYIINRSSAELEARGQILTSGIFEHTRAITRAVAQMLGSINTRMLKSGFRDGITLLSGSAVMIALSAALSAAFGYFAAAAQCEEKKFGVRRALWGAVAALAGIAIFYALADTRFTIRSMFFFTAGAAVLAGELLQLIPARARKWICFAIFSVTAFVLTVSGLGVVNQYKTTSAHDSEIIENLLAADVDADTSNTDRCVYLLDTCTYYPDVNSVGCWESIRAACSDYASLTGCLQHRLNAAWTNNLVPIQNGEVCDLATNLWAQSARFFALTDGYSVERVDIVPDGSGSYDMFIRGSQPYGRLVHEGAEYRFEKIGE